MSNNRRDRRFQQKQEERIQKFNEYIAGASAAIQIKDHVKSASMLKLALAQEPDNAQVLYLLATILNKDSKFSEAAAYAHKAVTLKPSMAEYQKELGAALKGTGKHKEALLHLKEALRLKPDYTDAHFAIAMMAATNPELGIDMNQINSSLTNKKALEAAYASITHILHSQGQHQEAIACQKELCRLDETNSIYLVDLGMLYFTSSKAELAIPAFAKAINCDPVNRNAKFLFTACSQNIILEKFDPEVKQALLRCFDAPYESSLHYCFTLWMSLLVFDPECGILMKARHADEKEIISWLDQTNEESKTWLKNEFLLQGIRLIGLSDSLLEKLFTTIRRYICLNAEALIKDGRYGLFFDLTCALAEQNFLNEYCFLRTPEEEAIIQSINEKLNARINTCDLESELFLIALSGCYAAINDNLIAQIPVIEELKDGNQSFSRLFTAQVENLQKERQIASALKSFGVLENQVSQSVRQQYEENPYPRWASVSAVKSENLDMPSAIGSQTDKPLNILIAGCGTGRHPIWVASQFDNAKVTAIDLSRASLAYGKRKAEEIGFGDRLQFMHADILSMKDWPEQFDIIESVGVLHHMEDPMLGWKTLTSKLKTGGFFKNGLYSKTARRHVIEMRDLISRMGFASTPDGIRACRKYVLGLPKDDQTRKNILAFNDFYSTSTLRDLLFHVQEQQMDLPQIKSMIEQLGLKFLEFTALPQQTMAAYRSAFPGDPKAVNLDYMHQFEQKNPDAFAGMYQFWCQKL